MALRRFLFCLVLLLARFDDDSLPPSTRCPLALSRFFSAVIHYTCHAPVPVPCARLKVVCRVGGVPGGAAGGGAGLGTGDAGSEQSGGKQAIEQAAAAAAAAAAGDKEGAHADGSRAGFSFTGSVGALCFGARGACASSTGNSKGNGNGKGDSVLLVCTSEDPDHTVTVWRWRDFEVAQVLLKRVLSPSPADSLATMTHSSTRFPLAFSTLLAGDFGAPAEGGAAEAEAEAPWRRRDARGFPARRGRGCAGRSAAYPRLRLEPPRV